jgi:hypothetical protein
VRLGLLLGAVWIAACDRAAPPTLHLTLIPADTLTARDTMTFDLPATLRPCEGDSAFLVEGSAQGQGALLLLRVDSLAAAAYPVGQQHLLAIRYQRPGASTVFRGDSGTVTIAGAGSREPGAALDLTIEGTVIDPYSVHRRVSGRLEGVVVDTTHATCAPRNG